MTQEDRGGFQGLGIALAPFAHGDGAMIWMVFSELAPGARETGVIKVAAARRRSL